EADQAGLHSPTHLPLEKIRSVLKENELVLEYFQVRDRLFACLLSARALEIFPVTVESRVSGLVRLLQFQLSKFRVGSSHVAGVEASLLRSTMAHLRELYKELLAPIDSQLEAAHLIVVPHGVLHYVPFHALADGEHYLIDRMSISYAPSGSVYALCC